MARKMVKEEHEKRKRKRKEKREKREKREKKEKKEKCQNCGEIEKLTLAVGGQAQKGECKQDAEIHFHGEHLPS